MALYLNTSHASQASMLLSPPLSHASIVAKLPMIEHTGLETAGWFMTIVFIEPVIQIESMRI